MLFQSLRNTAGKYSNAFGNAALFLVVGVFVYDLILNFSKPLWT